MTQPMLCAILDDYQSVALSITEGGALDGKDSRNDKRYDFGFRGTTE